VHRSLRRNATHPAWSVGWVVLVLTACAPANHAVVVPGGASPAEPVLARALPLLAAFEGNASWYGPGFAGRRTASGEIFDPGQLTAAHRTLPFGTVLRVTNLTNGLSVQVRINDRGPFKPDRVIDLSRAAAEEIDMIGSGLARVRVEPLEFGAGAVRLAVASDLRGFEARSEQFPAGQLLLLHSERQGEPVVVRVVGGDVGSGADLFVAPELYLALGPIVTLRVD
jgi:rare lipoprotein A